MILAKLQKFSLVFLSISLLVVLAFFAHFAWFVLQPLSLNHDTYVQVQKGSSAKQWVGQLGRLEVLPHAWQQRYFIYLLDLTHATHRLRAGEYLIGSQDRPWDILQNILAGKVVFWRFTIVEGWRFRDLQSAMQQSDKLSDQNLSLEQIAQQLNLPSDQLEGMFYPDTYHIERGTPMVQLLQQAQRKLLAVLNVEWQARQEGLPYENALQALTAASLIEKETAVADERPQIAGVIVRRLRIGMPLQMDPTVIYGLGDELSGRLLHKHLAIDTPYNTYLRKGLPPTPIALVSQNSIHAALHPASSDAIYFVAVGDGSGRHIFSADFQQHNVNIQALRLRQMVQIPSIDTRTS